MREEIVVFALGTPASFPSHAAGSRVASPPPPPIPRVRASSVPARRRASFRRASLRSRASPLRSRTPHPFLRSRARLSSLLRSLPRAHPSLPARCFPPISFPRADQLISTPSRGGPALRASLGGRPSSPPAGTPPPRRRRPRTPVEAQCTPPPGKAFPEIYNKLNCAATPPLRRRTGRHDLLGVNDDCKLRFLELKAKRTYRYITFKIEEKQKQIVVDKLGEPTMSYEDFTACLPAEECRYAIYDFDFVTEENCQKSKIFFIAWRLEKNYQKSVTGWITHILAKNLYRMWENYGKIQPFRKLTHGEVFCNFLTVHSTSWKIWTD